MKLDCAAIPQSRNLISRVWDAFPQKPGGVFVRLVKRVPVGAGLGGGSADAAAFLSWLNARARNPLPFKELTQLAADLGSDIPFFLQRKPCLGTGIGEKLAPVSVFPGPFLLLVWPGIEVSSAWAFAAWDALAASDLTNACPSAKNPNSAGMNLHNDLEIPVFARWPQLKALKEELNGLGAMAAGMSGSGSTIYGIFSNRFQADAASVVLRKHWPRVFCLRLRDFGM